MKIVHVSDGWGAWNGAANIARMIAGEQGRAGDVTVFRRWCGIGELRSAGEVWIHCGWKPCLWWAALWAKRAVWMPEACYDPVRLGYHGWKKRLAGPVERWALRRCRRIVVTCEAERTWVKAYLGAKCPAIEVSDIGRFFRLGDLAREGGLRAASAPLHVLYLGRRHPLKGVSLLERAVRELNPPIPQSVNSPIDLRIVSAAFGEELEAVWAWCDVLCLPTLSDNFGLVVAEALERGKRVVVTDGAPAWEPGGEVEEVKRGGPCRGGEAETVARGYDGRLVYLRGYRDGNERRRVELLKAGLEACRTA